MTLNSILVSVIVPVYNGDKTKLETALISIKTQSYTNFECFIVNDSSDQNIIDYIENFVFDDDRFTHIQRNSSAGLGDALNYGINACKGEFIARMDADDISKPDRFAKQVEFLIKNKDISVLGTSVDLINDEDRKFATKTYPLKDKEIKCHFNIRNAIAHPTVMFRSDIHRAGFNYDKNFKFCEDLELWLRLKKNKYKFANLSESLLLYRQNEDHKREINNWKFNLKARAVHFQPLELGSYISLITGLIHFIIPNNLRARIYKKFLKSI